MGTGVLDLNGCSSTRGTILPINRSMSARYGRSSTSQIESAMPDAPALPVRPMRSGGRRLFRLAADSPVS